MSTLCQNCDEQLQVLLKCIPKKWRDQIVYSICQLNNTPPNHCEIDVAAWLCQLPSQWKKEMIAAICTGFTLSACTTDCARCRRVYSTYLLSFPEDWRDLIITAICNIIDCKGCPTPVNCVTYVITPSILINEDHPFTYRDCEGVLQSGIISTSDPLTICADEGSVEIDNIFIVTQIDDNCNITTDKCYCFTITNIEVSYGLVAYRFSYEDCNGGIFTTQTQLTDPGSSTVICARPSSIDCNFAFSLVSNGECQDTC